ncbi:Protein of unknown function (DUF3435) domain containing protein [Elaphomyces granulatus]
MSLTRDHNAPRELSKEQIEAVERDPELQMERKYGSVPKAKGSDVHTEYVKIGANIRSLRQTRQREAFSKIREEFFDKVDTLLIDQQLLGLCVEEFKIGDREKVQFTFPERTRLAQNLFGPCKSEEDRGKIHARRVQVITDWVSLCNLRTPRNRNTVSTMSDAASNAEIPLVCPGSQCFARTYSFSRPDNLRRHEDTCHFRYLEPEETFTCPHPSCEEILRVELFRQHAFFVHNNSG